MFVPTTTRSLQMERFSLFTRLQADSRFHFHSPVAVDHTKRQPSVCIQAVQRTTELP